MSAKARQIIEDAGNEVVVSAASLIEICIKLKIGNYVGQVSVVW